MVFYPLKMATYVRWSRLLQNLYNKNTFGYKEVQG